MKEALLVVLALVGGGIVGLMYFGGLFLQLKYLSKRSLFVVGFFVRFILAGLAFFYVFKIFYLRQILIFFAAFFLVQVVFILKTGKVKNGD